MLRWNANFQIPNSGTQSAWVYLYADTDESIATLSFYPEDTKTNLIFKKDIEYKAEYGDIYTYLLTLAEYEHYERVS
jgi:hypothetical protein